MRLRYTPDAAAELDAILTYVASLSPQGARRVQRRIQAAIGLLLLHPLSGHATSLRPMRRIVATPYPYLIFYEATEDEVVILGNRHAARDPASMPGTS
ncbi:type II toxin-antitoxin system RelE/ParE family toxin [Methylobacterium sp. B4]|uniref:type II toxin-antitoxin system RelE/ParE family toxin n=1 Tax=Methylobacterium sp. B4 TaxID=1938755 RepID=UPI000D75A928|nr:type II toxin-antitoxin system RelE/ParE family toxin [Methylobacterium sp. B4]PXW64126.1 plasmid stabilization system protein ParE [Methylobacterium sp. B4]